MIRAALSLSPSTKRANSACVMLIGSAPCSASQSFISGMARAMSFAILLTTTAGVPAGAHTPYQIG